MTSTPTTAVLMSTATAEAARLTTHQSEAHQQRLTLLRMLHHDPLTPDFPEDDGADLPFLSNTENTMGSMHRSQIDYCF